MSDTEKQASEPATAPPAAGSSESSLPSDIVQSIAISNANSVGEQPAILANLALANHIQNANLAQQIALAQQQAMNQVALATTAKCVELIASLNPQDPQSAEHMKNTLKEFFELMNAQTAANLQAQQEAIKQCVEAFKSINAKTAE